MNQINKGTILVVVATAITAILILMTGRDAEMSSTNDSVVENNEDTNVISTESEIEESVENSEPVSIVSTDQNINIASEPVEISAPEGPFKSKLNEDSANTEATGEVLSNESLAIETSVDETSITKTSAKSEPIKLESMNVKATSTQHALLNHLIQPIWMDQKLGDFKSVEKGEVVFKIMPTNPNGLQGEDPTIVVTSKQDKFARTTVSADYNYQQMPMYNGGYYIAPMPPYLMQSVLPNSPNSK